MIPTEQDWQALLDRLDFSRRLLERAQRELREALDGLARVTGGGR